LESTALNEDDGKIGISKTFVKVTVMVVILVFNLVLFGRTPTNTEDIMCLMTQMAVAEHVIEQNWIEKTEITEDDTFKKEDVEDKKK